MPWLKTEILGVLDWEGMRGEKGRKGKRRGPRGLFKKKKKQKTFGAGATNEKQRRKWGGKEKSQGSRKVDQLSKKKEGIWKKRTSYIVENGRGAGSYPVYKERGSRKVA